MLCGIGPDPFDDCRWDDNRIEAEKSLLFHEQVIGARKDSRKLVRFVARLIGPEGTTYPADFEATFETAMQTASELWPEHRVMTVYPQEHHLRLEWLRYLDEL